MSAVLTGKDRQKAEKEIREAIEGAENLLAHLDGADWDKLKARAKPAARNLKRALEEMLHRELTEDDMDIFAIAEGSLGVWGAWHVGALMDLVEWYGGPEPLEAKQLVVLKRARKKTLPPFPS